jgi:hypothetical protein
MSQEITKEKLEREKQDAIEREDKARKEIADLVWFNAMAIVISLVWSFVILTFFKISS